MAAMSEEGKRKIEKTGEGQIELYQFTLELSDVDQQRYLNNHEQFMKEVLQQQGYQVNRVFVTTDLANKVKQLIKDAKKGSPVILKPKAYHTQVPLSERSTWI